MKHASWWLAGALIWGFAEATFFFIVPDILLTAAVLMLGFRPALRFAVAAAGAACVGGLIMFAWGANDPGAARGFLLSVPLVGDDLLVRVASEIAGAWPINLTLGALTGAPFKIYAVEAGAAGLNPAIFVIVGFAARMARFGLAIILTALGLAFARRMGLERLAPYGLAVVWVVIYGTYLMIRLGA